MKKEENLSEKKIPMGSQNPNDVYENRKIQATKKKRVNDQTNKQPISTVLSCVCQSKQKSKERFVCLFFFLHNDDDHYNYENDDDDDDE